MTKFSYILVEKMTIRYKRTYASIRQYMPNKLKKLGFKIWCFADVISKFVWSFDIYCGKSSNEGLAPVIAHS